MYAVLRVGDRYIARAIAPSCETMLIFEKARSKPGPRKCPIEIAVDAVKAE